MNQILGRFRTSSAVALAAVVLILVPVAGLNIITSLLTVGLYGIAVAGLSLLFGYAGQVSFGHAGFVALGAYLTALFSTKWSQAPLVGLVASVVIVTAFAWLLGLVLFRFRGHYLAMVTFAFGQSVTLLVSSLAITGGSTGLYGVPAIQIGGLNFGDQTRMYLLCWALCLITAIAVWRLSRSRVGRSFRALREDEQLALSLGIQIRNYKQLALALSAGLAALTGALYVTYFGVASPDAFGLNLSILLMAMVIVGGSESVWGAMIGAVFLVVISDELSSWGKYNGLFYGLIYVVVFVAFPGGLLGASRAARSAISKARNRGADRGASVAGGRVVEERAVER